MFHVGLFRLVHRFSVDFGERRRLLSAIVVLIRRRRRGLLLVGPLLSRLPMFSNPKLFLWQSLSKSLNSNDGLSILDESFLVQLVDSLRETHAYHQVTQSLKFDRNGFLQRGVNYLSIRDTWEHLPPKRVLLFHHYDPLGFLPRSWLEALFEVQSREWQVLFSTSFVQSSFAVRLQEAGVQIAYRANVGRCIGAYRDLALLLISSPDVFQSQQSFVCLNDSNLLIQHPQVLINLLDSLVSVEEHSSIPVLAGLTDSVERECYHLQSFLLYANRSLLEHPAWLRFWLQLGIDCSKDALINLGEIGLSKTLYEQGVLLKPLFPLVSGLFQDSSMGNELHRFGICQPQDVNQSLFAWRSLLSRGYPFIKKHVLFDLVKNRDQPLAISELSRWIPSDRINLISEDVHQLLISRFCSTPSVFD